jgi:hypothetical protein
VGWSLGYAKPESSEVIDAACATAGKALYLANAFEEKCKWLLDTLNLATRLREDPAKKLVDALATLPGRQMLGATLKELHRSTLVDDDAMQVLDDAREGRNFIAHEGASFDAVYGVTMRQIVSYRERLHPAVQKLVVGDNLVSTWQYVISEREPAPALMIAQYEEMVLSWVFDDLDARSAKHFSRNPPTSLRDRLLASVRKADIRA